jgi:hypothetical protein
VGVVEVHAILEKLDCGQTSIVLLRHNQSSDGIDNEIDTGCGLKEETYIFLCNCFNHKEKKRTNHKKIGDQKDLLHEIAETIQETCSTPQHQIHHLQVVVKNCCCAKHLRPLYMIA